MKLLGLMPIKVPLADGDPSADPSWIVVADAAGVAVAWKAVAVAELAVNAALAAVEAIELEAVTPVTEVVPVTPSVPPITPFPEMLKLELD